MKAGLESRLVPHPAGKLRIWDEPIPTAKYVIGIDVAENRVRDRNVTRGKPSLGHSWPDYSAACVLEMQDGQHVATWHGHMDPTEFAFACAAIGHHYNNALLVVEINGPGTAVVEVLRKTVEYSNLYRNKVFNRIGGDPVSSEHGFRTGPTTRPILISHIHQVLNYGRLFTRDPILVRELRTMEYDESGVERSRGRNKDDLVMAFGLALMGRAESLTGGLDLPEPSFEHLSPDDRLTKHRIQLQVQKIQNARRNMRNGGGLRARAFPRLPRVSD